jgi:hypothetical protein
LAFFFVVFLIGKYLQFKERQDKLTRKVEEALDRDMIRPWETSVPPVNPAQERRVRDRRRTPQTTR